MKTTSSPKNNIILNAHRRMVKVNGQHYLIKAQTLGTTLLADAEPFPQGGKPISLFDRTVLSRAIRQCVEARLFS